MAPKYKVTYFNIPGAAEPIRYILAYANQEFEDNRVSFADWPALKPDTPLGQLPVLELDGKKYPQSGAIARYLAKQFGLAGKDDLEAFKVDIAIDTLGDFKSALMKERSETDEAKKAEFQTKQKFYLDKMDKALSENPSGYFVGSQVTFADLSVVASLEFLQTMKPDVLKAYPNLTKLVEKISSHPNIKAYLDKRPKPEPMKH